MTRLVNEAARQLELYMWKQQPFMNTAELEEVSFAVPVVLCSRGNWRLKTPINGSRSAGKKRSKIPISGLFLSNQGQGYLGGCLYYPLCIGYSLPMCLKVKAQADRIRSHFIAAARVNTADLYDLNRCAADEERLQKVKDLLEGDKYCSPEAENGVGITFPGRGSMMRVKDVRHEACSVVCGGIDRKLYIYKVSPSVQ